GHCCLEPSGAVNLPPTTLMEKTHCTLPAGASGLKLSGPTSPPKVLFLMPYSPGKKEAEVTLSGRCALATSSSKAPAVHTVVVVGELAMVGAYCWMAFWYSFAPGRSSTMCGKFPTLAIRPSRLGSLAMASITAKLPVTNCGL